jgi:hypothetical protein
MNSSLDVSGAASLYSTLQVDGASTMKSSLDVSGATSLYSTLEVKDAASMKSSLDVVGATSLYSTLQVQNAASMQSSLQVVGASTMNSSLDVSGAASLYSTLQVDGASTMKSSLDVSGATSLYSTLQVKDAASMHSLLDVVGATSLQSTLYVGKEAMFDDNLIIKGNLTVLGTETILNVTTLAVEDHKIELNANGTPIDFGFYGNLGGNKSTSFFYEYLQKQWALSETLSINGKLKVNEATSLKSSLDVSGATSLNNILNVNGATTINNILDVTANITTVDYIIKDSITSNTITLNAPSLSNGSFSLTLPNNDGEFGQVMYSDGNGNLNWYTLDVPLHNFAGKISVVDYRTSNVVPVHLTDYDLAYQHQGVYSNEAVHIQYSIPYETSIQADQRISFELRKSTDNFSSSNIAVGKHGLIGTRNATGGLSGVHRADFIDTNLTSTPGDLIKYRLYSILESNVTATDSNGTLRTAGVRVDEEKFGYYHLTQFRN